jgi:hypothetical protein
MDGGRRWNSGGDDDAPYLPERYRRQVSARKQRRLVRKILVAGSIVAVVAVMCIIFLGNISGTAQQSLPKIPAATAPPQTTAPQTGEQFRAQSNTRTDNASGPATPAIARGSGLQALTEAGVLPLDSAIDLIRLEFPAPAYTIASVNLTEQSGRKLYEFMILGSTGSENSGSIKAGIDAVTGEPYTSGQQSATITAEQVKRIAGTSFPSIQPDQIRVRYLNFPDRSHSWEFFLVKDNATILTGSMDTETGQIASFSRQISMTGRPAAPLLSLPGAQKIADQAIAGWNGPLSINMSNGQYESTGDSGSPVAGRYVFEYNRIVQDIPCDEDGFTVAVDSVSGNVTAYERRWSDPDNAFSVASEPLVIKREATFAILQKAKEIAPESVSSVRILSAELLWKDKHAPGVTPRPGTIPLAWKVTFDDDILRAGQTPIPATGWVDARTGAILDTDYHH